MRTSELLIKSEANLLAIFNNSEVSFILLNTEYNIISYNDVTSKHFKYQFITNITEGANYIEMLPITRRKSIIETLNLVMQGEKTTYEENYKTDKGMIWHRVSVSPVTNKKQQIIGTLISTENITSRKNMELEKERMSEKIIQHSKNMAHFAHIISHNLRSPVANIIGLSNMIQSMPNLSTKDLKKCMEGMTLSASKLDETIIDLNNILEMRLNVNGQKEYVNFNTLVKNITNEISPLVNKEHVEININFQEVEGFKTITSYIHCIFYNLITNSIKYKHPVRTPVIEITSKIENGKLILLFSDNGQGIDLNAHKEKIFGLYKKFNTNIEGKGMGLYLIKNQVEMLGGKIDVKSEVGIGTEFKIVFFI